jgi:hypothetical protein
MNFVKNHNETLKDKINKAYMWLNPSCILDFDKIYKEANRIINEQPEMIFDYDRIYREAKEEGYKPV